MNTKQRWEAMAQAVAGGESLNSVATRFHVCLGTVKRGCDYHKIEYERCGNEWVVCRSVQLYTGVCVACGERFGMKLRAELIDKHSVPPMHAEFAYCWECAEEKLRGNSVPAVHEIQHPEGWGDG
jgi:hypothetical protein